MTAQPLAAILTLGCKLNLADSEEIARALRQAGFGVVDHLCEADAFVVNTCSVTHVADQKSRRLIRSVRRLSPGARVAVTGCFPQSAGFDVARDLGADFVAGTRAADKAALVRFLVSTAPGASSEHSSEAVPPARGLHARAFVKAQEGCNDVCAFCIVPRTRGREESRDAVSVAGDVQRAVEAGAREVVITGTQLGAWGRDLDPPLRPHHLVAAILERTEVARLRFSSLQPQDITPGLLSLWSDPRLMPHFHLALQSGSDAVLRRMRRRYTANEFVEAAERIRAVTPDAAITTDVITGFPGESDEDFAATLDLCERVGFARLHCFPYSARSRTLAARMAGQAPSPVTRERMGRLLSLANVLSLRFREHFAGEVRPVLWERPLANEAPGSWMGHTDNYIEVVARGEGLANRITPTRLDGVYHGHMTGTIVAAGG